MVDLIMIAHSCLVANEKIACICLWLESVEQSHRSLRSLRSVLLSLSMSDNSSSTTTCLANSSSSSKNKIACTCSKCMRANIQRSVRLAHQHAMDALDYTTQFINDTDRKIKKKRKRKGKNKKAGVKEEEPDVKKEKKDDKGDDNGDDIGDKGGKDGLGGKLELPVASVGS